MKKIELKNFLRIMEDGVVKEGFLFFDGDEEALIASLAEIAEEEITEEVYKDILLNNKILYKKEGGLVELKSLKIFYSFKKRIRCGWLADWAEAQENQKCNIFDLNLNLLIKKDGKLEEESREFEIGYEYDFDGEPENFANLLRFAKDNHSINIIVG